MSLERALRTFDPSALLARHRGRKESASPLSHEYLFSCPACGGDNLRYNSRRFERGAWVCWNCHLHGDTVELVKLLERTDYETALRIVLSGYVGGDGSLALPLSAALPPPYAPPKLSVLPTMAWPALCVDARQQPVVRAYLASRGITDAHIESWQIKAGTSVLKDRAIFPVFMDGGLVYWQARAAWGPPAHLDREARKAWIADTHYRKVLNPPNALPGIRQASAEEVLFNFDRAHACPHVVVCEGPVDAIKVGTHAVALLGKGTDTKIARLRRMLARRYTIYLDRGQDERDKALRIAAALSGYAPVFIATPPEGKDAGDLTWQQSAQVIDAAVPVESVGLASDLRP